MKTSQKGIELIKKWESFEPEAYICPANILTIGYGHTGKDVFKGQEITKEQAEKLLQNDLITFEEKVKRNIKVELNQNQFDALVSYFYNIGYSATIVKFINSKASDEDIYKWFTEHYITANGKVLNGLIKRRKEEAELYLIKNIQS